MDESTDENRIRIYRIDSRALLGLLGGRLAIDGIPADAELVRFWVDHDRAYPNLCAILRHPSFDPTDELGPSMMPETFRIVLPPPPIPNPGPASLRSSLG